MHSMQQNIFLMLSFLSRKLRVTCCGLVPTMMKLKRKCESFWSHKAAVSKCIRQELARSSTPLWPGGHEHRHEHDQKTEQPGHTCWTREGATQVTQGKQTLQNLQRLQRAVLDYVPQQHN